MHSELSCELAAVAVELADEPDVEHTTHTILDHAEALTGGDSATIMIMQRHHTSLTSTSPEAEKADLFQLEHHEGPGLAAMAPPRTVVVDDVPTDARWRQWRRPVAEMGLRSVISMPLGTTRSTLGALNVYSRRPHAFAADGGSAPELFARHASVALDSVRRETRLRQAIDARNVIGQAQGVLMERHGLDIDTAFAVLRNGARDHRITLAERARQIAAGR